MDFYTAIPFLPLPNMQLLTDTPPIPARGSQTKMAIVAGG